MLESATTARIIGAAITVHKRVGPGLLESTYEACLEYELRKNRLLVQRQVEVPLIYDGITLTRCAYRIDLLVNEVVIVEVKSVSGVVALHEAQLLTCLRITEKQVGLLINFNVVHLKNGILRRVLSEPG